MFVAGKIDSVIDDLVLSRTNRFYPTYIVKCTGIPFEDVYKYLITLVEAGKLNLKWEIICDSPGCCHTLDRLDSFDDVLGKVLPCYMCGEDIEITEENILPVFEIAKDYKNDRKEYFGRLKKKNLIYQEVFA